MTQDPNVIEGGGIGGRIVAIKVKPRRFVSSFAHFNNFHLKIKNNSKKKQKFRRFFGRFFAF